jgi:hypothetical protein
MLIDKIFGHFVFTLLKNMPLPSTLLLNAFVANKVPTSVRIVSHLNCVRDFSLGVILIF